MGATTIGMMGKPGAASDSAANDSAASDGATNDSAASDGALSGGSGEFWHCGENSLMCSSAVLSCSLSY